MVRRFAEAGVERLMLQDFIPRDLDQIDVMGELLIGQVSGAHPRSAGGVRRGPVARVVAADRVGVRPARPGDPFGQELERCRRAEERRDRRRQLRRLGDDEAARRRERCLESAATSAATIAAARMPSSRAAANAPGPAPAAPAGQRDPRGSAPARCPGRSRADGRGGTSRGRVADGTQAASSTLRTSSRAVTGPHPTR